MTRGLEDDGYTIVEIFPWNKPACSRDALQAIALAEKLNIEAEVNRVSSLFCGGGYTILKVPMPLVGNPGSRLRRRQEFDTSLQSRLDVYNGDEHIADVVDRFYTNSSDITRKHVALAVGKRFGVKLDQLRCAFAKNNQTSIVGIRGRGASARRHVEFRQVIVIGDGPTTIERVLRNYAEHFATAAEAGDMQELTRLARLYRSKEDPDSK